MTTEIKGTMINKQGNRLKWADRVYPSGATLVRCRINGVGKAHWHKHQDRTGYIYGDPRFYVTLCGKPRAQQLWGPELRVLTLKDACKTCERLRLERRNAEATAYARTHDEDGEPIKQPTPKERAAMVKAKALARPKKPWQPKNKQRSIRRERAALKSTARGRPDLG